MPNLDQSRLYRAEEVVLRNHGVNGDGFGVAWSTLLFLSLSSRLLSFLRRYAHTSERRKKEACASRFEAGQTCATRYRSTGPAWNDANLGELSEVIVSGLIMAHVRAASPGSDHNQVLQLV